jgi:hypothetical protein
VAAYLLLVGVPVLGLLGILEAGRGIRAPLSVGGEWAVEAEGGPPRQLAWTISQSGPQATITLHDGTGTKLDARIDGATLTAGSPGGAVAARIAGRVEGRRMEGEITLPGCAPVAFHAVRQAAKKEGA